MGKRKTKIGVKSQKGLFRFINRRPLNDYDGAQWKVGRSPKCNRECNILKKPLPSKVRTFDRMRLSSLFWDQFTIDYLLVIENPGQCGRGAWGGRSTAESYIILRKKILKFFFQDFLVRNLEIIMPFKFFSRHLTIISPPNPLTPHFQYRFYYTWFFYPSFFFKLSVSFIMLWMKFFTPGL